MDQKRPYIFGSLEPCYDINPKLWNVFCALTNRPIGQPNYNWTEHDVITFILARGLQNDPGKFATNNDKSESVELRPSYNIRRDPQTGNVMAVWSLPNSDDACLFIIGA